MTAKLKRAAWGIGAAAIFSAMTFPVPAGNTNAGTARSRSPAPGKVEKANSLIGHEIRNGSNQPIARISELVVDLESGRVLYAIVSIDGTAGKSDRLVAVPPGAFLEEGEQLQVIGDWQKLLGAPTFLKGEEKRPDMESPDFVMSVYKWFEQSTWWEPGAEAPDFVSVHRASELVGMDVRNMSDQKIGHVENVMIDLSCGRVPYVILSPDPNLHLQNNNLYALPPNSLTSANDGKSLNTSIDRDKLAAAPRFDKNHWPDMSNPGWASRVYQAFGKQAFFEDGTILPTSRRTNSPQRIYHEPEKSKP
jgi:sporulation protein YlmC with PRC-barrel domain